MLTAEVPAAASPRCLHAAASRHRRAPVSAPPRLLATPAPPCLILFSAPPPQHPPLRAIHLAGRRRRHSAIPPPRHHCPTSPQAPLHSPPPPATSIGLHHLARVFAASKFPRNCALILSQTPTLPQISPKISSSPQFITKFDIFAVDNPSP